MAKGEREFGVSVIPLIGLFLAFCVFVLLLI